MQQEEKGRNKGRINFNFEKIFNNQEILNLIESLGIAEATFLQAKILPEIINKKDYLIQGDSLSGKTLMCGLLLAFYKINNENYQTLIVADNDSKDRIVEEFSKLNLFDNKNFKVEILSLDTFKKGKNNLEDIDTLIFDSIEENEENNKLIIDTITKIKSLNKDAQVLICNREISHELEKAFRDVKTRIASESAGKEEVVKTEHYFCMLGAELTAKLNALCDILEIQGRPATIIFCNQPSDTDMVEAVLNKNGMRTTKLIGNAYYSRVMNALNDLENGAINAIIATDIGAKQINVRNLELVINYSTPENCDTYLSRMGKTNEKGYLKKVINFIHPLDLINFHQVRKGLDFDIVEVQLPTVAEVCKARFDNYVKSINESKISEAEDINEKLEIYYQLLNESDRKDDIIKYMIYNSLIKVSESSSYGNRKDRRKKFENRPENRSYKEQNFSSANELQKEEKSANYKREPQIKDVRFYIGLGDNDNFSEDAFINILKEFASEYADKIKRFSLRNIYSFVDFQEDIADEIENSLKDALFNGNTICFKRATTINIPREDGQGEDAENDTENENDYENDDENSNEDNSENNNENNNDGYDDYEDENSKE
ncbi:MAG: helicase-related protein [Bdellovibrionota bacterium]